MLVRQNLLFTTVSSAVCSVSLRSCYWFVDVLMFSVASAQPLQDSMIIHTVAGLTTEMLKNYTLSFDCDLMWLEIDAVW